MNANTNTSNSKPQSAPTRGPMGRGGPMGHGRPMAMMKGEKARDFKGTMAKLLKYLGNHKTAIAAVMLIAAISTIFSIAGPKILGKATTKLFEGVMAQIAGKGVVDFKYIGNILLLTLGLYLFSSILSYIQGWVMTSISMKVTYKFRQDIAGKINRMPLRYFDGTNHGEILSRVTNDVDTVSQTLNQSLSQVITSVTTLIGTLVMMLSISWQMTSVALVILPIAFMIY